jgi:hypothetical protein
MMTDGRETGAVLLALGIPGEDREGFQDGVDPGDEAQGRQHAEDKDGFRQRPIGGMTAFALLGGWEYGADYRDPAANHRRALRQANHATSRTYPYRRVATAFAVGQGARTPHGR